MSCRTGCPTQTCRNYGECCRRSNITTAALNPDFSRNREKRWNAELDAYNAARKEGIEPDGTTFAAIDRARRISDATGKPYNGERPLDCFKE